MLHDVGAEGVPEIGSEGVALSLAVIPAQIGTQKRCGTLLAHVQPQRSAVRAGQRLLQRRRRAPAIEDDAKLLTATRHGPLARQLHPELVATLKAGPGLAAVVEQGGEEGEQLADGGEVDAVAADDLLLAGLQYLFQPLLQAHNLPV